MMVAVISIFYAAVAFFEIAPLKKQGETKKIILYSFVLITAFVVSILIALGVKIPSINRVIGDFVFSITGEQ